MSLDFRHDHAVTFYGTGFAASISVDLVTAILLQSLTLGPLALSDFATPAPPRAIFQHLPAEGVVTSAFGARRHPILGSARHHDGIDIANAHAASIYATAPGRVARIARDRGYGLMVEIDHGHGWRSRYAHLAAAQVSRGAYVFAGAIVGQMGASGRVTGTHLHYELRHNGMPVNPAPYLRKVQMTLAFSGNYR